MREEKGEKGEYFQLKSYNFIEKVTRNIQQLRENFTRLNLAVR